MKGRESDICLYPLCFTDKTPSPVIESCTPNPCANNGTCFDLSNQEGGLPGDYACKCTAEWTGPDCSDSKFIADENL